MSQVGDTPFLTYCIPHYNAARLLPRCLKSLKDTPVEYEIIIIDDCSESDQFDSVKELIASIGIKNITLLRNFKNRGVSFTKNRCYWHARGTWCVFIDCDDFFVANGVRHLCEYLFHNTEPIQLFHCDNYPDTHVLSKVGFTLQEYVSSGSTGGEALTVINKDKATIHPYFSQLRGYEGLGLVRLAEKLNCGIVLGNITPRYYTSDAPDRLSIGKGLRQRLRNIARGHMILIAKYGKYLNLKRKLVLCILFCAYNILFYIDLLRQSLKRICRT